MYLQTIKSIHSKAQLTKSRFCLTKICDLKLGTFNFYGIEMFQILIQIASDFDSSVLYQLLDDGVHSSTLLQNIVTDFFLSVKYRNLNTCLTLCRRLFVFFFFAVLPTTFVSRKQ